MVFHKGGRLSKTEGWTYIMIKIDVVESFPYLEFEVSTGGYSSVV